MAPHNKEGVSGPELMELMRQQAVNFGTRIITEDVVDVDFSGQPFKLTASDGNTYESHAVIVATGARANYLGLPSEEKYQEPRRQRLRGLRRRAAAIPQQAAGGDRRRRFGRRRGRLPDASSPASSIWSIAATNFGRRRSWPQRAEANPKIEILWNRTLAEVLGNDKDGVTGVRLASTVGEPDLQKAVDRRVPGDRPHAQHGVPEGQAGVDREEISQVDDARPNVY